MFADSLLTGIVSQCNLRNQPLKSSCVVATLVEKYSTSKPLNISPEKSIIFSCDPVVTNERLAYSSLGPVIETGLLSDPTE